MAKIRTLNKQKVIDAAVQLVEEKGVESLTLPKLAQRLNIRSQSLYNYVANRQELLDLVGGAMVHDLQQAAINHIIGLSGLDALSSLADFIREYSLNHPAIRQILVSLHGKTNKSSLNDAVADFLHLIERLKKQSGVTYFPSPHIYLGAIFGYIFLDAETVGQKQSSKERWSEYHEMLDSICRHPGYHEDAR